jgi:hypothetical protein
VFQTTEEHRAESFLLALTAVSRGTENANGISENPRLRPRTLARTRAEAEVPTIECPSSTGAVFNIWLGKE